jgi:hypothetical protein
MTDLLIHSLAIAGKSAALAFKMNTAIPNSGINSQQKNNNKN